MEKELVINYFLKVNSVNFSNYSTDFKGSLL